MAKTKKSRKVRKEAVYANGIIPVVGMGATYSIGSDRYAQTITAVNKTGKTIKVVHSNEIYENGKLVGYDDSYTPDTGTVYTLRKNGYFHAKGSKAKYGYLSIGNRNSYRDPHF